MYSWRRFWYPAFRSEDSVQDVLIRPSVKCVFPWKLTIGDHSWIGDDVSLYTLGEIEIRSNRSYLRTATFALDLQRMTSPTFDIFANKITIGDEMWLASDVFIAPGVTIGKGAVVGVRGRCCHDLPGG